MDNNKNCLNCKYNVNKENKNYCLIGSGFYNGTDEMCAETSCEKWEDAGMTGTMSLTIAIKALEQQPKTIQEKQAESEKYEKAFDDGYENGYAQARFDYEQQPRWIPISEIGYPKPEDEYKHFITIDNKGEITIQEFLLSLDEEPQPYFSGMRNIVAYINMPLPKPYKVESEDQE